MELLLTWYQSLSNWKQVFVIFAVVFVLPKMLLDIWITGDIKSALKDITKEIKLLRQEIAKNKPETK